MLDQAWIRLNALAGRQHGVFTREQAASLGIDSRRLLTALRAGRVISLGPRILCLTGQRPTLRRDARAATLLAPGVVASHRAAAALLGFDGITTAQPEVTLLAQRRLVIPRTMTVTVHHTSVLERKDIVAVAGIPCTSKARTLADLGAVVSSDEVLHALIGAHRDGLSLRSLRSTAERLHRPGQQGTRVLLGHLDAFDRAGTAPESWFEEVLRRILNHPELPPLVSQFELRHQGRFVARFDHAFPQARVAVEAHSKRFHFGPVQEAVDEDRDLRAQRAGWVIVYLGWHVTRRPAEVVELLKDIVRPRLAA